jgi:phage replication initiation protein
VLVDWIEWTEQYATLHEVCARIDPYGVARDLPGGGFGYRRSKRVGPGVQIYYDGTADMGVHVRISGEGCRHLEATRVVVNWRVFLGSLDTPGVHISRIDVAFDDRRGLLDLQVVLEACEAGHVVSRWRAWARHENRRFGSSRREGVTVSFGSSKSDMCCRIYDKAAHERAPGTWTRVELQSRDARAGALAERIAQEGLPSVAGVLRGYLDFKTPARDSNRRRWPTAPWWDAFLRGVAKARLAVRPRPVRCLREVEANVERQYGPTLALIHERDGADGLVQLAARGIKRIRQRHREMLAETREGT